MSKHHWLGDSKTDAGYYKHWVRLLKSVNLTTSDSFWINT